MVRIVKYMHCLVILWIRNCGIQRIYILRNCVAMAKDSRSTFPIIDENGCPVDPTIFPRFTPDGTALQSVYEAFRFTESYGVIFQCNVKYCLGPCEPVSLTVRE